MQWEGEVVSMKLKHQVDFLRVKSEYLQQRLPEAVPSDLAYWT